MEFATERATAMDISERLARFAVTFDERFAALLTPADPVPDTLGEAVRYAALGPGKRVRPYLVIRACELVGGEVSAAWPVAAAVECIHAFSLVHDDLPAMDDDDLRRGRPACHKQFDEATAILAGDALVMLAFELAVRPAGRSRNAGRLVTELAKGAGWSGMIGGQVADIQGQSKPPSLALVKSIHERKTARLFETACRLGAITGGGDDDAVDAVGDYGRLLGCAFQIADDLLDLTASEDKLGKRVGKDAKATKQTYPQCVGYNESRVAAQGAIEGAVLQLERFRDAAEDLRELAAFVVHRDF